MSWESEKDLTKLITVSTAYLSYVEGRLRKLCALELAGVDNWAGYVDAEAILDNLEAKVLARKESKPE